MAKASETDLITTKLGAFLQKKYVPGVLSLLPIISSDWDAVKSTNKGSPDNSEQTFSLMVGNGPAATQFVNASSMGFTRAHSSSIVEASYSFKELQQTIEIPYNQYERIKASKNKWLDPLEMEVTNKAKTLAAGLSVVLNGDGTGVVAQVSQAPVDTTKDAVRIATVPMGVLQGKAISAKRAIVPIDCRGYSLGFVSWARQGDLLVVASKDGTTFVPFGTKAGATLTRIESGTAVGKYYAMRVIETRRVPHTLVTASANPVCSISVIPVDIYDQPILGTNGTTVVWDAAEFPAGSLFYRVGQANIKTGCGLPNLTPLFDTTGLAKNWNHADLGDITRLTDIMPGFGTYYANDGRNIFGLPMDSFFGAQIYDCGARQLNFDEIQSAVVQYAIKFGSSGDMKLKDIIMANEVRRFLFKTHEADTRILSTQDEKRGIKALALETDMGALILRSSENCPFGKIRIPPYNKLADGSSVFEFFMSQMKVVRGDGEGDGFRLKVEDSGYVRALIKYMEAYLGFICRMPSALLGIENFTFGFAGT